MSAEERKGHLKQTLRQLIGEFEANEGHKPVLLEQERCDGYIRERVELSAIPGLSFAAYVLIPEGNQMKPMPDRRCSWSWLWKQGDYWAEAGRIKRS